MAVVAQAPNSTGAQGPCGGLGWLGPRQATGSLTAAGAKAPNVQVVRLILLGDPIKRRPPRTDRRLGLAGAPQLWHIGSVGLSEPVAHGSSSGRPCAAVFGVSLDLTPSSLATLAAGMTTPSPPHNHDAASVAPSGRLIEVQTRPLRALILCVSPLTTFPRRLPGRCRKHVTGRDGELRKGRSQTASHRGRNDCGRALLTPRTASHP
jgi:hypothetical protein